MDKSLLSVYPGSHFVQFYSNENVLVKNLTSFIGGGIASGDPCIVIATASHREILTRELREKGLDIESAQELRTLVLLDADTVLSTFMVGNMPDKQLFRKTVGEELKKLAASGRNIRAFGEMVAILFKAGNPKAALSLERLWNEISAEYVFSLYCAYPATFFEDRKNQISFENLRMICNLHGEAYLPTGNLQGLLA